MISPKHIAIFATIAGMVVAGSLAIDTPAESVVADIDVGSIDQEQGNELVIGNSSKPVKAPSRKSISSQSTLYSANPVQWAYGKDPVAVDGGVLGPTKQTTQSLYFSAVQYVYDTMAVELSVDNLSEDNQLVVITVDAGSSLVDVVSGDGVKVGGLVGPNQWIASISGDNDSEGKKKGEDGTKNFLLEITVMEYGVNPISIQLEQAS